MSTYRTSAFVISRRNFQENNRVYILYTEKAGKIEAMARGSRKILSKLSPHLDSPVLSEVMIARGKRIDKLAGAMAYSSYPKTRSNFFKIQIIFSCFHFLDALTRPNQRDEKVWKLLEKFLKICEDSEETAFETRGEILKNAFLIKLLTFFGYRPELERCVLCREENLMPPIFFDYIKGGLLCSECKEKVLMGTETYTDIDQNFLEETRSLLGKTFKEVLSDSSFQISEKTKKVIFNLFRVHRR